MKKTTALALFAAAAASAAIAAPAEKPAARPAPGPALRERLEKGPDVIGIVHWGLNTFENKEWGYGNENPAHLNPSDFDAGQIADACKEGGIGGLVIVAKHHDGFCLWPTKTTDHNISKSPFRGGKGDYVKEMEQACRRAGIEFGVYVSPWDRNNAHYGTAKYVELYHEQIKELLGGAYGKVFEMWFDGANGGDGWYGGAKGRRRIGENYYRFDEVFAFVRKMQPGVCIFAGEHDSSDFRWPGNEQGWLHPDSRATITTVGGYTPRGYGNPKYRPQINTGSPDGAFFRACEADFPLRRGWFWHEKEKNSVKNSAYLTKLYLSSVGNGGIMNIGLSPDTRGRLSPEDVKALKGFAVMRKALFANEVEKGKPFNVVELSEDLSNGEQVDGWKLLADGKEILSGKAIGRRRIRLLKQPVSAAKLELAITADGGRLLPVKMRLYNADPELVKTILEAKGDGRETDTARWMTAGQK